MRFPLPVAGIIIHLVSNGPGSELAKYASQKEHEVVITLLVLFLIVACTIAVATSVFFYFLRLARRHRQEKELIRTTYRHREGEMRLLHQSELEENARLRQEVERLRVKEEVTNSMGESEIFGNTQIFRRVKWAINHPKEPLTEQEWTQLVTTFAVHYPQCYQDICQWQNKAIRLRVCILTAIGIRNGEQAALLDVPKQTITNNMAAINLSLFDENSAKSLYSHLTTRYKIYVQ